MIFDPGLFTSYEDKKKRRTGNISAGFFRDTQGLHVWVWLARVFTQLRTYTVGLGLSIFFFSELRAPFTNLCVLINTDWSLISRFFAENAVVGRLQHSWSFKVALTLE